MSTTNTTDGKPGYIWHSNGHPTGPTIRGPWGEIKAFDPATGGFTIILRPQKPPRGAGMPDPEPAHTERKCPRCHVAYPFPDTAYWQPIVKRGKPTWFSYCRACNAERRRPAA